MEQMTFSAGKTRQPEERIGVGWQPTGLAAEHVQFSLTGKGWAGLL